MDLFTRHDSFSKRGAFGWFESFNGLGSIPQSDSFRSCVYINPRESFFRNGAIQFVDCHLEAMLLLRYVIHSTVMILVFRLIHSGYLGLL